jgi:hypothetical protein
MSCAVPGCPGEAASEGFGVCEAHRREETAPTPQELEAEIAAVRLSEAAERDARLERYSDASAPLGGTSYGRAALAGLIREVAQTTGGRNVALFRSTARAAGLAAGGHIEPGTVREAMEAAGRACGLGRHETRSVVMRAIRAGLETPRGPVR